MANKSVVAKSNEDVYSKFLEAMADKSVSPWVVVIRLLRSGRLLSVANQSSLPYSESYLRQCVTNNNVQVQTKLRRACLGMGNLRNHDKVVTFEQLYIYTYIGYNIYIVYIQLLIMHLDQIIFLK